MSSAYRKLSDYLWRSPEQLSKQLKNNIIDSKTLSSLIGLSLSYVEGQEVGNKDWMNIVEQSYLPSALIEEIFSEVLNLCIGVFQIPQQSLTRAELLRDLSALGFSQDQAEKILESKAIVKSSIPQFPRVKNAMWRVEVTISSSALSRVVEPWILLELNLNNGQKKILQLSLKNYHNLRHQVASTLHKLQTDFKTST